jgi:hypothetical protein
MRRRNHYLPPRITGISSKGYALEPARNSDSEIPVTLKALPILLIGVSGLDNGLHPRDDFRTDNVFDARTGNVYRLGYLLSEPTITTASERFPNPSETVLRTACCRNWILPVSRYFVIPCCGFLKFLVS